MKINIDITDKFKVLQKGGISAIQEAMELSAYECREKQRHSRFTDRSANCREGSADFQ